MTNSTTIVEDTLTPAEVAQRIERIRRLEGRSIVWVGIKAGIADKTLRRRMVAPEGFTLAELSAIARVLNRTLEQLLTLDRSSLDAIA